MAVSPIVCMSVAGAALGARYLIQTWQAFKARPAVPRMRRFYPGGFQTVMTRREAALILGVREHAVTEKITEAYKGAMRANHPDLGGSEYLAKKISEARDLMLGKTRNTGSAF